MTDKQIVHTLARRRVMEVGGGAGLTLLAGCIGGDSDPVSIEIERIDHPESINQKDFLPVDVDVINRGGDGTQMVALHLSKKEDSDVVGVHKPTLAGHERTTVSFGVDSDDLVPGTQQLRAHTTDDSLDSEIQITE